MEEWQSHYLCVCGVCVWVCVGVRGCGEGVGVCTLYKHLWYVWVAMFVSTQSVCVCRFNCVEYLIAN